MLWQCYDEDTSTYSDLFGIQYGTSCYDWQSCPKCGCPDQYSVDDEWYQESTPLSGYYYSGFRSCDKCTCVSDSEGDYISCNTQSIYLEGAETCGTDSDNTIEWVNITCHSQTDASSGTSYLKFLHS